MQEIFECVGTLHILIQDKALVASLYKSKGEEKEPTQLDQEVDLGASDVNEKEKEDLVAALDDLGGIDNPLHGSSFLSQDDLPDMAVGAATRALDRILDSHMIQVSERFAPVFSRANDGSPTQVQSPSVASDRLAIGADGTMKNSDEEAVGPGSALVPREFLNAILEAATMYSITFSTGNGEDSYKTRARALLLNDFIMDAYSTFLTHVRSVFMDESLQSKAVGDGMIGDLRSTTGKDVLQNENATAVEDAEDEANALEEEICSAQTLLVQYVKDLSSGLALPEVGVNETFTAGLVDEAMQFVDSMATRRVHQKFQNLRFKIVKSCLLPFAERLVEHRRKFLQQTEGKDDKAKPHGQESFAVLSRQLANGTLSDFLQLVDDTIRTIVTGSGVSGNQVEHNQSIVKEAAQESIRCLVDWLAGALEAMAGGEAGNTKRLIDVPVMKLEHNDNGADDEDPEQNMDVDGDNNINNQSNQSYLSTPLLQNEGIFNEAENLLESVYSARSILSNDHDGGNEVTVEHDMWMDQNEYSIAIAEMCRLAQGSLSENLEQSMDSHLSTGKRKSRRVFDSGDDRVDQKTSAIGKRMHYQQDNMEGEDNVSKRFKLAASRIFALYAQQRGASAALILTSGLDQLEPDAEDASKNCKAPRDNTWKMLEQVKVLALECARIFDNPSRACPVSDMDDGPLMSGMGGLSATVGIGFTASAGSIGSSLRLDVEKIFKEKLVIHLHPLKCMEFSRNAVLFLMLKEAFRDWFESIRMRSFSRFGYMQLMVDVEFLKHMLPHYIDDSYQVEGNHACSSLTTLLSDLLATVCDNCIDDSCETDELLKHDCMAIVRNFMASVVDGSHPSRSHFIIEQD